MYCKLLSHLYFHPKQQSCYFPQDSDKYQSHFHSQQHFQQQSLHIPHPNVPIQFHCDNLLQYSNIPCYIPDKHLYSSILQHYRYMFQPYICCNQTRCQHRFCLIIIYFESDNIICITINHHKKNKHRSMEPRTSSPQNAPNRSLFDIVDLHDSNHCYISRKEYGSGVQKLLCAFRER